MKDRVVAFVPLRLNSKRLPNKNLLDLGGCPLSWYIFKSLLGVQQIDTVYAYCSDPSSVQHHLPAGVVILQRPERLDGDTVRGLEIYRQFLMDVQADIYVLAHATSPFLRSETISRGLEPILSGDADSALTVVRHQTFAWYQEKPLNYSLTEVPRTQELDPVFIETSGFYIFRREVLADHGQRIGFNPHFVEVDGMEAVDIDLKSDLDWARRLMTAAPGE